MALNLDVSKLTQSAAMKATPHDNCVVLDLGTGAFPRDIEVRLPDDDGARQNALWDGSLNLAINDEVLCFEYAGLSAWRIMGMGGNDNGADKVRASKVWESDFGAVALETDASGNVTINGARTLTIPTDLIHAGDPDTKIGFTDDALEATIGGLSMLKLTETSQNLVEIGDTAGGGDVDIDFNSGQMVLEGSSGFLRLFQAAYGGGAPNINADEFVIESDDHAGFSILTPNNKRGAVMFGDPESANQGQFRYDHSNDRFDIVAGASIQFIIEAGGNVFIATQASPTAALGKLHVDQQSTIAAIPTLYLDQADVSEEMIQFETTIGVGNAIEAVGAKALTVTHFIKVTLPGGLTRYFPIGTIA